MLIAMLFATILIGGTFILTRSAADPQVAEASQESDLLATLATRDSTGDGLPDWEKALYGIPLNATTTDYFHLGMTDGEAVKKGLIVPLAISDVPAASSTGAVVDPDLPPAPGEDTLTAAFAKNLFTAYLDRLQSQGGTLSSSDLSDIANQALGELGSSITAAPAFKRAQDLTVQGSGPAAMKAFAAAADAVMRANSTTATKSELDYLADVENNGDASALGQIESLAKLYRSIAAGIAVLPVPEELATDDLALVNALARMSEVTNDFAQVNTDPLVTMLAIQQYPGDVQDMGNAFIKIQNDFNGAGITFAAGESGGTFVNLMQLIAAAQASGAAPTPPPAPAQSGTQTP